RHATPRGSRHRATRGPGHGPPASGMYSLPATPKVAVPRRTPTHRRPEAAMAVPDFDVQAWLTRQLDWERDLERLHQRAPSPRRRTLTDRSARATIAPPRRPRRWSRLFARLATSRSPERGISGPRRTVTIGR